VDSTFNAAMIGATGGMASSLALAMKFSARVAISVAAGTEFLGNIGPAGAGGGSFLPPPSPFPEPPSSEPPCQ